ncbi:hypothetical protein M8998_06715 [Sphingobacterium sp. lm-10]|uniref:tetratricopeptide repeat protein n=1 Tax=Sphingobacterium sp. lm-10 TaxID=2944904 RepID=UPI002021E255|nr:hypothetical protein [Sphingobacterium sp. lm-10]MCL7987626.1 hypothetical protein [Sphingobacterium sp. lm-10]
MRVLIFILFLLFSLFCFACTDPVGNDFTRKVNHILLEGRNNPNNINSRWIADSLEGLNVKEKRILSVIQKIQRTQQEAATQTQTKTETEWLLKEADSLSTQIGDPSLSVWVKSQIGYYYYHLTQLEKALPYFVEVSKYLAVPNFEPKIDPVDCLLKNAYFFGNIGDHQLAINNLEDALLSQTIGQNDTALLQYALGYHYQIVGDSEKAKTYFLSAKSGAEHRNPIRYAKALGELALLEMNSGNSVNAEDFLLEDINLSKRYGDARNAMFARIRLGKLYIEMQRWEEASAALQKAEAYAATKENLLGFQREIIQLNLLIQQHAGNQEAQLALHHNLREVEEQVKYTDGEDAVMNVKLKLLREESDWSRIIQENKLQKSNLTGIALLFICTLLIILVISLRVSKLKSLRLQQSEFEYKITTIELAKFKSDNRYEQAQLTIQSYLNFIEERNHAIDHLKEELTKLESTTSGDDVEKRQKLQDLLSEHLMTEDNWYRFKRIFIAEYRPFYDYVVGQLTGITESQLRIVLLQKIGVTNHEMANLLGIGQESIRKAKQRLRKKYGDDYEQCFHVSAII